MTSAAAGKQTPNAVRATHVIGPVPGLARAAGVAATAAGILLIAGLFLTYLVVGGQPVSPPHGLLDLVAAVVWPVVIIAAGVLTARAQLPRLGLAVIGGAGAIGVGAVLQQAYQLVDASRHLALEVFLGQPLLTSSITPRPGLYVAITADGLLVLALVLVALSWPGTVMDDAGDFDGARPLATGLGAITGLVGAVSLAALAVDIPARIVSDPSGFQTVVDVARPVGLLDRMGLDQLGGVLVALAVLVVAVTGASLRPRLATVGSYAVLAAYFTSTGLGTLLSAVHSDALVLGLGGGLQLLSAASFCGLTVWCARVNGVQRYADRLERGQPASETR